MKISKWDDEHIWFEDGTTITYKHEQDCCESNWADFSVLDVFYHGEEFDGVKIETVDKMGFKLVLLEKRRCTWRWHEGNDYYWYVIGKMLIPCYSDQNGYYSTDLTIVVMGSDGYKKEYELECLYRDDGPNYEKPDFYWEKDEEEE